MPDALSLDAPSPPDEPAETPPGAGGRTWLPLVIGAVATVLVGFGIGFAVEGSRHGTTVDVAAPPSTPAPGTAATPPPTTAETTTTAAPSTTASSTTTSTTTAPTTTAVSRSTVATSAVTVPTTARPTPTAPPTTLSPPFLTAQYAAGAGGALVIPKGGSASFVLTNTGGLATQWLLSGSGFTAQGAQQGTLNPGQSATVTVAPRSAESSAGGTIVVLGPNPLQIPFVIG